MLSEGGQSDRLDSLSNDISGDMKLAFSSDKVAVDMKEFLMNELALVTFTI
jgi:hypothetical protein